MIHALIADDHSVVREGLRCILSATEDIRVGGEAASLAEIRQMVEKTQCNVLVLDLMFHGCSSLEILKELKSQNPRLSVLILSVHSEDQFAIRCLKAGASGFLNKECASEQLVSAIRKVATGGRYLPPRIAELLANHLDDSPEAPKHQILSDRELEVMTLIGSGLAMKEISRRLALSVKTVSTYRTRVLKKLKLSTNSDIIRYVIQHELVADHSEMV